MKSLVFVKKITSLSTEVLPVEETLNQLTIELQVCLFIHISNSLVMGTDFNATTTLLCFPVMILFGCYHSKFRKRDYLLYHVWVGAWLQTQCTINNKCNGLNLNVRSWKMIFFYWKAKQLYRNLNSFMLKKKPISSRGLIWLWFFF